MTADPNRLEATFAAALAKGSREERAAYLDEACAGDAELRRRVEALLKAHDDAGSFLERPAGEILTGELPAAPRAEQDAPPSLAEGPGTRIGPYKLLQQIGEGGMGVVYMAEQQEPIRRMVALKIIKPGMDTAQVVARFEAERQALALMDHQNIARVFDGGTTDTGRPYFVMELVKGIPITRFCDENRLTPRERLELFVPVCQAVQHAHQKGVIHRDLKPTNVLVTLYDGRPVPKVIDFGVAKALHQKLTERTLFTAFGVMVGTLEYMSPEQAELNALDVDTRSDVYALGVLLYELLTGSPPLERERLKRAAYTEVLRLIREEEPPRPSTRLSGSGAALARISAQRKTEPAQLARLVRGELDWILMKALEKDRGRRYETASGLARDVERYLTDEPVEACPPSVGYRLGKFARKNRAALVTAAAFTALLFLVVGLVLYGVWWADRQAAERRHEQALLAARNNDALNATLDQLEAALKAGRLEEAAALLGQADKRTDEQTAADLRDRHERLRRDERTVRELNDIFEERWMISRSDTRLDNTRAKRRYPELFHGYGLTVGREAAAATIAKVRDSVIAEALASGMTEWFFVDPQYPGLLAVADLLDHDPVRATLRAAIAKQPERNVNKPIELIDGSRLLPAFAVGLANRLPDSDSLRILKAAWTAHPDSFALALVISVKSFEKSSGTDETGNLKIEAVGWSRIAVALRPDNPVCHYRLAVALGPDGTGDTTHAVEELRRAVQLAPGYGMAHGLLALVLYRDKNTEALAAARKAIQLDSENFYGHVALLGALTDKKEYVEAARVWRRIKQLTMPLDYGSLQATGGKMLFNSIEMASEQLLTGLLSSGRPFEAYRLWLDAGPSVPFNVRFSEDSLQKIGFFTDDSIGGSKYYAARAAALAGTGHGLDAPPPAEQPAIRRHALEWLTTSLDDQKKEAAALPVFGASTVGLMGSPFGLGPLLLAVSAQPDESLYAAAKSAASREDIHDKMNHWLGDPDLAGIRDDQGLDKLPAEEQAQWRKLWGEVRSLRDWTAPGTAVPTPIAK